MSRLNSDHRLLTNREGPEQTVNVQADLSVYSIKALSTISTT